LPDSEVPRAERISKAEHPAGTSSGLGGIGWPKGGSAGSLPEEGGQSWPTTSEARKKRDADARRTIVSTAEEYQFVGLRSVELGRGEAQSTKDNLAIYIHGQIAPLDRTIAATLMEGL
jgi:hypothetical protein